MNVPYGIRPVLLFMALSAALFVAARGVTENCVGGKITSEQATMLNDSDWKDCPEFRHGVCVATEGDGLLRKSCNNILREFLQ